jgi:hypothetical protein
MRIRIRKICPFPTSPFSYLHTMKRLDQGHLHPKPEVPRLTCPGRELNPGPWWEAKTLEKSHSNRLLVCYSKPLQHFTNRIFKSYFDDLDTVIFKGYWHYSLVSILREKSGQIVRLCLRCLRILALILLTMKYHFGLDDVQVRYPKHISLYTWVTWFRILVPIQVETYR